jgi:hypothetical protein
MVMDSVSILVVITVGAAAIGVMIMIRSYIVVGVGPASHYDGGQNERV